MVSAIESNVVVMNQSVREKFGKVSKQIDEQSLLISTECVRFEHGRKIKGVLDMAKWQNLPVENRLMSKVY